MHRWSGNACRCRWRRIVSASSCGACGSNYHATERTFSSSLIYLLCRFQQRLYRALEQWCCLDEADSAERQQTQEHPHADHRWLARFVHRQNQCRGILIDPVQASDTGAAAKRDFNRDAAAQTFQ